MTKLRLGAPNDITTLRESDGCIFTQRTHAPVDPDREPEASL
jgi:hypothetical protein